MTKTIIIALLAVFAAVIGYANGSVLGCADTLFPVCRAADQ